MAHSVIHTRKYYFKITFLWKPDTIVFIAWLKVKDKTIICIIICIICFVCIIFV